ncbi:MAG: NAD-dependent dihydropyrimidine dehydrogenase subunit PreA, partial [Bacteroidales bacterium]|nr:NAD-dependent dihydropyrimidine dehydrogenase subunit PreA [Candidatus Sodaliphilus fimicaballi]
MDKHFESTRCLVCHDAPCTAACPRGNDPARGVRAHKFENNYCVGMFLNEDMCADCDAPCEKACIHPDFPIRIKQ